MSRYCLYCGKEITGLHANAKYCSPECKMICYKERYKRYKKEKRAYLNKEKAKKRADEINKRLVDYGGEAMLEEYEVIE